MPYRLLAKPIIESFVDNILRDTVKPKIGSIVYCDLCFNTVEHSGVYVGNGEIVHLDGSGIVEKVSAKTFLKRLGGFNTAMSIYVSSNHTDAVGKREVANRAISQIGKKRVYNLTNDNCHQFTTGCLTSNFENNHNFFFQLKEQAKKHLNCTTYRVWKRDTYSFNKTVKILNSQKSKEVEIKEKAELNIELIEFTSLLLHYIIDEKTILPTDIIYFQNIIKDTFACDEQHIIKDMYEMRRKIQKNEIETLIQSCFIHFTDKEQELVKSTLRKVVYEDEKGKFDKHKDIRSAIHNISKAEKIPDAS